MKKPNHSTNTLAVSLMAALVTFAMSRTGLADSNASHYSPYANPDHPQHVFWGDLHVHTEESMDANSLGNRLSPDKAYRFAKGETVVTTTGVPMKLSRPLDFLLVSDHAEFMGLFSLIRNGDRRALASGAGKRWSGYIREGNRAKLLSEIMEVNFSENQPATVAELELAQDPELVQSVWEEVTATADRHNEPGHFTAFIGYEWTSQPRGDNLHRNILFEDSARRANQVRPFSSQDSQDPEALWQFLDDYERRTGGRAMAIPHNANGSNGLMFSDKTYAGDRLTRAYARSRARWEPIVEVTQIKGDGESHPFLSPDDEFADFELWDDGNMGGGIPKENWMLKHEYARGALTLGLELENRLGSNPYKFGMIGSSDTHTSLAAVEENNFSGKFSKDEPGIRLGHSLAPEGFKSDKISINTIPAEAYAAAGYAAVWATENTRDALFDAMQRRETYATTGPRMTVRFFGGWNFQKGDEQRSDFAALGYARGVPMGGDLVQAPGGKAPVFLIVASKDPIGANLDRVQVIKGWLDKRGKEQEKVYDVALSDGRDVDPATGKAPLLESTVDVGTATYTNSVGAAILGTVWEDPDFDPHSKAFYYARVIEIATPRWTTYEAAALGLDLPGNFPPVIQERAYTSPIWYTP